MPNIYLETTGQEWFYNAKNKGIIRCMYYMGVPEPDIFTEKH